MNGIKYHRIRKGLTQRELAKRAGVSVATITSMEQMTLPHGIYGYNYIKVHEALGVTVDELIRSDFPDDEDGGYLSVPYPSITEKSSNCISRYRRAKGLTYDALALRLGVTSRERARQVCAYAEPAQRHLNTLAVYEGISIEEFCNKYSCNGAAA